MRHVAPVVLLGFVSVVYATLSPPPGFADVGPAPFHTFTPILVAITQPRAARVQSLCAAVSDPDSPVYGKHVGVDELGELLGAHDGAMEVRRWLEQDLGAMDVVIARTHDFVQAMVPVATIEEALSVSLRHYMARTPDGKQIHVHRSLARYTLPKHVAGYVDLLLGVSDFPDLQRDESGRPPTQPVASSATTLGYAIATDDTIIFGLPFTCPGSTSAPPPSVGNVCGASPIANVTVRLQPSIQPASTVTVPASALFETWTPGFCFVNLSISSRPFQFYNVSAQYTCANGTTSPWLGLPFDWQSLPSSWQGLAPTPAMTPDVVQAFYGLHPESYTTNVTQGVAEFNGWSYRPSDLQAYSALFQYKLGEIILMGKNDPAAPVTEPTMDIELITAVAPGVASYFWATKYNMSRVIGAWMLEWAMEMSNHADIPDVSSLSYGLPECNIINPVFPCGNTYYQRANMEMVKLCARGSSVIACAQDGGATSDGHGSHDCGIHPVYPATSPWVTAVGSTLPSPRAAPRCNSKLGEVAASIPTGITWTTGGGFSSMPANAQPAWQAQAVERYIHSASKFPPSHFFNVSRRAYPDVSMVGSNYPVTMRGFHLPLGGGTSSSTPVFAGVITLLNQARAAVGKSRLGFLNPLLYKLASKHPEVFYDVVEGGNRCGATLCCPFGYEAAVGFDVVTGLGSIGNYTLLRELVLALP